MSKQNIEESVESRVCFEELEDWVREKIRGGPHRLDHSAFLRLDSAVLVAASKGNSERGRA